MNERKQEITAEQVMAWIRENKQRMAEASAAHRQHRARSEEAIHATYDPRRDQRNGSWWSVDEHGCARRVTLAERLRQATRLWYDDNITTPVRRFERDIADRMASRIIGFVEHRFAGQDRSFDGLFRALVEAVESLHKRLDTIVDRTVTLDVTTSHEDGPPVGTLKFFVDHVPRNGDVIIIGSRRFSVSHVAFYGPNVRSPQSIGVWPFPAVETPVPIPEPANDDREVHRETPPPPIVEEPILLRNGFRSMPEPGREDEGPQFSHHDDSVPRW